MVPAMPKSGKRFVPVMASTVVCPRVRPLSDSPEISGPAATGRASSAICVCAFGPATSLNSAIRTRCALNTGLRVLTNLVDCAEEWLRCDLEVEVVFARHGKFYIPLFRPIATP